MMIQEEGGAEGGVVVQDCLELLNNLLRNNQVGGEGPAHCCRLFASVRVLLSAATAADFKARGAARTALRRRQTRASFQTQRRREKRQ